MPTAVKRPDLDFRHAWTLALLGGLLASAAGVFLGVQVGDALQERALLDAQRLAVEPPRMVFDAVRLTQAHRQLAHEVLSGRASHEPLRRERAHELDAAMQRLAQELSLSQRAQTARADWSEVQLRWRELAHAVEQRRVDAAASHRRHGELIEAELDVHDRLLEQLPLPLSDWERALWQQAPQLLSALEQADGADTTAAPQRAQDSQRAQRRQTVFLDTLAAQWRWQAQQWQQREAAAGQRALVLGAWALLLLAAGLGGLRRAWRARAALRLRVARHEAAAQAPAAKAPRPADLQRELTATLSRRAHETPHATPAAQVPTTPDAHEGAPRVNAAALAPPSASVALPSAASPTDDDGA